MKLAKKGCRSCRTSIVTQPAVSVERCVMVFRTPTIGSSATIPEPVKRLGEYQACMVWEYQACMVHPSQQLRYAALSSTRYPLLSIAHSTKAHLIKQIKPIENKTGILKHTKSYICFADGASGYCHGEIATTEEFEKAFAVSSKIQ